MIITIKKVLTTLIFIFTLSYTILLPIEVLAQPSLSNNITSTNLKNTIDNQVTSNPDTLSKEHKVVVENAVKSIPYGGMIWSWFGEIIVAGLGLGIYAIRAYIKKLISKYYKKLVKTSYTNKDIEQIGVLNTDINNYLTTIKDITKAKRVLLYQFSNGSHFFSNIPVLRMTVTNYSLGDNIKQTDNYFNYETAKEVIHQILSDECVTVTTTNQELKYYGYISYLKFSKFKDSTLIRLNVSDTYCGVIEIIEPTEFNVSDVRSYAISIGHLFEKYSTKQKSS